MAEDNYPEISIFTVDFDSKGREYKKAYTNFKTKAVVTKDGKNMVFEGNPLIFLREGDSVFGEELVFGFKINEEEHTEYKTPTKNNCIEYYLPKKRGIQFLKDTLKYLEGGN